MRKAILVVYGTYVASRSIMFERSCLLPNIDALYINSPVPPCDCGRKYTATTPLLVYVTTIYSRRDVFNACLQILLVHSITFRDFIVIIRRGVQHKVVATELYT